MHLYDHLKQYKTILNINDQNEWGETPIMIALNEKAFQLVDKMLKDFKENLDLQCSHLNQESLEDLNPTRQARMLHPLMLAVKYQQYDIALRILDIMVRKHKKTSTRERTSQEQVEPLLLNMKDENKNTLMHYLFMNFSTNMELSVELCQELLKQNERGAMENPVTVILGLNETNKQGMTPIDLATEQKQNQAIEFAIYYNKNMLPAFQVNKKPFKRETFDLNSNRNQRGVAPLHRAITTQNYKAIYLFLQSGECNVFLKDKDFRTARDYCQKILFLSKYLRKGESNQLRAFLQKVWFEKQQQQKAAIIERANRNIHLNTLTSKFLIQKQIQHNNLNFFTMLSKRGNRIKYNSWYSRLNSGGIFQGGGISGYVGASNNKFNYSSSQQQTLEKNQGDQSDDEEVKIEDIKDDDDVVIDDDVDDPIIDDEENSLKQYAEFQKSIICSNIQQAKDHQSLLSQQNSVTDRKVQSLVKQEIKLPANEKDSKRLSESMAKKLLNKTHQQVQNMSQQKQSFQKTMQAFNQTGTLQQLSLQKSQQSQITNQSQKIQPQISSEALNFEIQDQIQQQFSDKLCSKNIPIQNEKNFQDRGSYEEDQENENETSVLENEECHSTLPSNQYKYVMTVNNSKLARKPYYKQIQKNRFEREFCIIMDPKIAMIEKMKKLYYVFSAIQQQMNNPIKEYSSSYYRDGREFLGFLKLELENKDENLKPLRNEIQYFQEIMLNFSNQAITFNDCFTSNTRKNTNNFSLERRQILPMIEEAATESLNLSPNKQITSSTTQSPLRMMEKSDFKQQDVKLNLRPSSKTQELENHENLNQNNPIEQEKSPKLYTTSSIRNIDFSGKGRRSSNNSQKSKLKQSEESKNNIKIVQMKYNSTDEDSSRSPTSPKGDFGKIVFRKNNNQSQKLQSPSKPRSNPAIFSQPSQKAKESCIKKVEVQISERQSINASGDKNLSNKWKQLTINPNAQSSSLQASKGLQKIATTSKISTTPQSQKSKPTTSQLLTLTYVNLASQNQSQQQQQMQQQLLLQQQQQQQLQQPSTSTPQSSISSVNTVYKEKTIILQPQTSTIVMHTHTMMNHNKTSSSLSNRSNSNPRNSLINSTTVHNSKMKTQSIQNSAKAHHKVQMFASNNSQSLNHNNSNNNHNSNSLQNQNNSSNNNNNIQPLSQNLNSSQKLKPSMTSMPSKQSTSKQISQTSTNKIMFRK